MARNLGLRKFLELMNECYRNDEESLQEINRLMKGLITDKRNLMAMRQAAGDYIVQAVVMEVWEDD